MPVTLYVRLTDSQRTQLQALRRDPALQPGERDRVEMFLLSDQGWQVPPLARHLGRCEAMVRRGIRQFETEGVGAVRHKPMGTGPHHARRQQITQALDRLLADKDRVWSSATLAEALVQEGFVLRPRTVRPYLHPMGARYRRTAYTVRHRQDPDRVAQARTEREALKKVAGRGARALLPGRMRLRVDDAPHLHRVPPRHAPSYPLCARPRAPRQRAGGAGGSRHHPRHPVARPDGGPNLAECGPADLSAGATPHRRRSPARGGLDNASLHRSRVIRDARPELDALGIPLPYLPPYAPERNDSERVFRTVKHTAMPVRTFEDASDRMEAVANGFATVRERLRSEHASPPGA